MLRKRRVVERGNAWHGRCRRSSKDYERRPGSSDAVIPISYFQVMHKQLAAGKRQTFNDRNSTEPLKNSGKVFG